MCVVWESRKNGEFVTTTFEMYVEWEIWKDSELVVPTTEMCVVWEGRKFG
jgi:hypothetical protein